MIADLIKACQLADLKTLGIRPGSCPICGPTLLVRLADNGIGVRCARCRGSVIAMSLIMVLQRFVPDLSRLRVYEMSSRGPVFEYLSKRCGELVYSEYFEGIPTGSSKNGTQCQDVQRLTYSNTTFDLCTSTEVFEHVADDMAGFREIHRVLRQNGYFVFTVPLTGNLQTVERAQVLNGTLRHILPPEYHNDRIRGRGKVLCFRDYGKDITARLVDSGFSEALIAQVEGTGWWGRKHDVVIAKK